MTTHDQEQDQPPQIDTFKQFVQFNRPDFEFNWHHNVICDHLDRFARGEIRRLMLMMPPRHSKTELISRQLPAYLFALNPDISIIACSHTAMLANFNNRDVRRYMESAKYINRFPQTRLPTAKDRNYVRQEDLFEIADRRGYYRSAGVGGAITGMGFNVGIIDDPIKNRADANSETHREMIWDWYTSTFYTRQEKDAGILITLTRWHIDDLCARLLLRQNDPDADQWTVLRFPALAEGDLHPEDKRDSGEALWRGRQDEAFFRRAHLNVGEYDFQSLYQQTPLPDRGGLFHREKFRFIDAAPTADEIAGVIRFWDLAFSQNTSADYTVGIKLARLKSGRWAVLDMQRFQHDWGELSQKIAAVAIADGDQVTVGVEQLALEGGVISDLLKHPQLGNHKIRGYRPLKDKFTRAMPLASRLDGGLLDVLRSSWTDTLLDELCAFPHGKHDDIVDACSGAYRMLLDAASEPAQVQVFDVNPFFAT